MSKKPIFNLVSVDNNKSNMPGGRYGYNSRGGNYTSAPISTYVPTSTYVPASTYMHPASISTHASTFSGGGDNEALYKHKAKKYHYKCQLKLKEMEQNAKSKGKLWVCPAGFEKYLSAFSL